MGFGRLLCMRTVAARNRSTRVVDAAMPENDPAWMAVMNAPLDDTPETEQERADVAEAMASGRFSSGSEVRSAITARAR